MALTKVANEQALIKLAKTAGIPMYSWKRGPHGKEVFIVDRDAKSGWIGVWKGSAELAASVDINRQQMVLRVTEPARTLHETIDIYDSERLGQTASGIAPEGSARRKKAAIDIAKTRLEVNVRDEAMTVSVDGDVTLNDGYWQVPLKVDVVDTVQTFLLGFDEITTFISALPENVTSVTAAHKALRPAGLSKNAVRQGEWFFDPAPQEIADRIDKSVATGYPIQVTDVRLGGSTHWATASVLVKYKKRYVYTADGDWFPDTATDGESENLYVTGVVYDDRGVGHHTPLYLHGWHRVALNNELEAQGDRWD